MTFQDWLDAVETTLKSNSSMRVKDLDPDGLRHAFESGLSPVLFAKLDALPVKPKGAKAVKRRKSYAWLVLPFMLIPVALTIRFIMERRLETTGWDLLLRKNVWPVALPLKTPVGPYTPAETESADTLVRQHIAELLLAPGGHRILSCEPVSSTAPGTYIFDGTVESKNQYGTVVQADFRIVASRPIRVHRTPGLNPEWSRLSEEWKLEVLGLTDTPTSSVWNRRGAQSEVKSKAPAKRLPTSRRPTRNP